MKRNGFRDTYYAAKERLKMRIGGSYSYVCPDAAELARQKEETGKSGDASETEIWPSITLVMPAYNPPEDFFRQAADSVINQSYQNWNLVICDASDAESHVSDDIVRQYTSDPRVTYLKITKNRGISENTNTGIEEALRRSPDYIGFMDHDDVLTPDALYHMACAIRDSREAGSANPAPALIYSDEDKMQQTDSSGALTYFDPHRKYDFNYDLFLTNNYICHLMLVRSDILENIRFRPEYDGAQDYDLALQIIRFLCGSAGISELKKNIIHVQRILYHWRSHIGSTATNTESKSYAYEAGLRALTEHVHLMHSADVSVSHSKHLGFYDVNWGDVFARRPDIGAIIGRVIDLRGQMISCIRDEQGNSLYAGLNKNYAGEFNRFDCAQDVYLADIRYVKVRPELESLLKSSTDSESFARELRDRGCLIYYDPSLTVRA